MQPYIQILLMWSVARITIIKEWKINAVPLITFHNVGLEINNPYTTNVGLFNQLMKYLHDNGFKVLTFKQLGYDTNTNTFYLKGV